MTNGEKYRTSKERTKAFNLFCKAFCCCEICPFYIETDKKDIDCKFHWLESKVKEKERKK